MTDQNESLQPTGLFSPDELRPATGSPDRRINPKTLAEAKKREPLLRSVYVQNPTHTRVFQSLDMVMALGDPRVHQYAVRNAAASFAGKSSSADAFIGIVEKRGLHEPGSRPVVRVELEQACTSRRFWLAITDAYGDGFGARKDEDALRRSAFDAFERHGTRLLIIDEVQHAGYRSNGSSSATDVIKRFISAAPVGIALFGNEDSLGLLKINRQLSHRMLPPCDIRPLTRADMKQFAGFVGKYDQALVDLKLFAERSNLDEERVASCLMTISSGFLGRAVTLVQTAARFAHLRQASRVEVCDLSAACVEWAVAQDLIGYDPFRFGASKPDA